MNILTVSKLTKQFSGETLFENISFDINSKNRIAIIGKNGTGKTTLLKMILQQESIDSGEVHINKQASIGYLSQNVLSKTDHTLEEEMLEVFSEILFLEQRLQSLSKQLEKDPHNQDILDSYSKTQHHFTIQGGYDYHYKIDLILTKFGFKKDDYNRHVSTFSGGEKTRIAFAKLLLINPNLLVLDEPTNHLDIDIIEWLEDYLNKYDGAILLVTHDKYFISKVCNTIIEIDQKRAHMYYGSYDQYVEEKLKRYELQLKRYTKQQKEIAHLQSFVDRFRYNAKRASIAQDRVKKIERMDKIDAPHMSKKKVKMIFEQKRATKEIILALEDVSIGYDQPLLSNINFTMRGFDKLAIIGPNGTGKTTLLKVIEQKLKPLKGKVEFLRQYKIGYFDQNQETLHQNKTIFEEIHDYYPLYTNYDIRSVAARFLFFDDDLHKPINILSGGEKVRLVLLLLMLEDPDLLILDEPTNHLDIETKDIIEDVFSQFGGPIIFVSHDRYFINRIGTKIVHLSDQEATVFEGSYDQFKVEQSTINQAKAKKAKKQKPKNQNLNKQIHDLEEEIHELEQTLEQKKQDLFKEENYIDGKKMKQLNNEIEELESTLHELFDEYIHLLEERGEHHE